MPESVFARWNESRARRGLATWDPSAVYHLRGVPDEQIGISVDVSSVADRVVAGLREHRSQQHVITEEGVSDERWSRAASREHLVIAWPERPVGGPRLASVFEGLD
jgi:hypothetical protein